MADWQSIQVKFDIFEPLRPPIEAALQVLEAIEAVLEALLDLIKPFLLDLLNPLRAIVAALLAAVRAIINQIRSTGFAILLVHPDFSQPDFSGTIYSVSGAYPRFESKVVAKFFDSADLFRPQYPPGSSVAMLVLYVGADSPGNLLGLLYSLLALIKHPLVLSGLPAPVDVKALPVTKGTSSVSQFRRLFDPDLNQAVQLEWRMPQSPSGVGVAGFVGQISSFYNQFRFPNFVVERHGPFPQDGGEELSTQGEVVRVKTNSQTLGRNVDSLIERYNFPGVNSLVTVREEDGTVYRNFGKKIAIQYGSDGDAVPAAAQGKPESALSQTTSLVTGIATGKYKFLDDDPELVPGKTYYYRIRAFFGDATEYLDLADPDGVAESGLVKQFGNQQVLRLSPKLTLGKASRVVRGFVPRASTGTAAFNAYNNLYDAIRVGLLLNMELPPANSADSAFRQEQKTGWGTLGMLGGQIGFLKATVSDSKEIQDELIFNSSSRRLANSVAEKLFATPALVDILSGQWNGGVSGTVDRVLNETQSWKLVGIVGGITPEANRKVDEYLSREEGYHEGQPLSGPLPVTGGLDTSVLVQDREDLASFLRTGLSVISSQTGYLAWYSVTVGDLFPALTPFLFDLEQFLLALLKAVESALKEIEEIVETLLAKIRALKQILETLLSLIDILNVNVSVSVLATGSTNGSAQSLVQDLLSSENKPGSSPFGLHSGMVMTFGGPGEGFIAAFEAIKYILTLPG